MDKFFTIRFRRNTAQRFKKFSKRFAKSYSEGIDLMMDFFEWHGFRPNQRFEKSLMQEILKNRKRTEANIAILRDIEKTQTKPLSIQMDLLFEGQPKQRETPKLVEKKFANSQGRQKKFKDKPVPKVKYQRTKTELKEVKEEFLYVMEKVLPVKNSFGKDYLKMEISLSEFNRILANLKEE